MDGGGRAASGTAAEGNAGAVADEGMDARGRATQEQLPSRSARYVFQVNLNYQILECATRDNTAPKAINPKPSGQKTSDIAPLS